MRGWNADAVLGRCAAPELRAEIVCDHRAVLLIYYAVVGGGFTRADVAGSGLRATPGPGGDEQAERDNGAELRPEEDQHVSPHAERRCARQCGAQRRQREDNRSESTRE